jgi:hypothetical protein
MNTTKEHISKLFVSKGMENSNLWIEGARLLEAGFNVGREYSQVWYKDRIVLTTASVIADETAVKLLRRRVQVTDKNEPLIRIEGVQVQRTFTGFDKVKCVFENGRIEVTGYKEETCNSKTNMVRYLHTDLHSAMVKQ